MNTSNTPTDRNGASASSGVDPVLDEAKHVVDEVKAEAKNVAREAQTRLSEVAEDASQQARSFAEENKSKVAAQVTAFSGALGKAAEELEKSDQTVIAGYARDVARGIDDMSTALRERGVDDLMQTVQDFARKQPAAFLGAAALAGFVASRFAKASTSHAAPAPGSAGLGAGGNGYRGGYGAGAYGDGGSMAASSSRYPDAYDGGRSLEEQDGELGSDGTADSSGEWRGTSNYKQTERGH